MLRVTLTRGTAARGLAAMAGPPSLLLHASIAFDPALMFKPGGAVVERHPAQRARAVLPPQDPVLHRQHRRRARSRRAMAWKMR